MTTDLHAVAEMAGYGIAAVAIWAAILHTIIRAIWRNE